MFNTITGPVFTPAPIVAPATAAFVKALLANQDRISDSYVKLAEDALADHDAHEAGDHLDPADDHPMTEFTELFPASEMVVLHPTENDGWVEIGYMTEDGIRFDETEARAEHDADRAQNAYERAFGWGE